MSDGVLADSVSLLRQSTIGILTWKCERLENSPHWILNQGNVNENPNWMLLSAQPWLWCRNIGERMCCLMMCWCEIIMLRYHGFHKISSAFSIGMSSNCKLTNVEDTSWDNKAFKISWSLNTHFVRQNLIIIFFFDNVTVSFCYKRPTELTFSFFVVFASISTERFWTFCNTCGCFLLTVP